tara:strand:- start:3303 stop:3536 length:234 start_codon:yes stop_codon:yes gene_type:complete
MIEKAEKVKKKASLNTYTAGPDYKSTIVDKGLFTEDQHLKLKKGESIELFVGEGSNDVPEKWMRYLTTNNLIIKGEE